MCPINTRPTLCLLHLKTPHAYHLRTMDYYLFDDIYPRSIVDCADVKLSPHILWLIDEANRIHGIRVSDRYCFECNMRAIGERVERQIIHYIRKEQDTVDELMEQVEQLEKRVKRDINSPMFKMDES